MYAACINYIKYKSNGGICVAGRGASASSPFKPQADPQTSGWVFLNLRIKMRKLSKYPLYQLIKMRKIRNS